VLNKSTTVQAFLDLISTSFCNRRRQNLELNKQKMQRSTASLLTLMYSTARDLDGVGPGAQAWWEAPWADTKCLGRG